MSGNCADVDGCTLNEAEGLGIFHNKGWRYNPATSSYDLIANDKVNAWSGFWGAVLENASGLQPKLLMPLDCHITNCRNDQAVKVTTNSPRSSQNPCFSPDGQFIAFTRFLGGYNAGASEIVKMKIDGTNEQVIVSAANSGNVNVPYGCWVGDKIVFTSDRAGMADEIWIVGSDGSNLEQITTHSEANGVYYIEAGFNPQNANQIVFEYVTGENDNTAIHQIGFLDVITHQITLLTNASGAFDDRLPSWSHDGSKIFYQRNNFGQGIGWKVYVSDINIIGTNASLSNTKLINHGDSEYTDCSWSFNDAHVICSIPFGGSVVPNIWMFPLDESLAPIQKTLNTFYEDGAPSQSHDGNNIAFESHYGDSEEEPSEIWVLSN
ncbi:MAG: PD40 domain-containing protein [Methylococcales bacterium]|nr:PD40 domain-containing protein [Methylococcales bacterium]